MSGRIGKQMNQSKNVLVVGGGAAGLMAAGTAARRGHRVTILEKMERPGRKLMITGKGRCNLTNQCDRDAFIAAVHRNGRFLYSAYTLFDSAAVMAFFEELGLPLRVERGNRVFPASDRAVDVVDALAEFARRSGAVMVRDCARQLLLEENRIRGIQGESGREYTADAVVLATGGRSYPLTGSTGDGYRMARAAGHTTIEPKPSLVPLNAAEDWCRKLQGLSLKNAAITVMDNDSGKTVYADFGEMLFTHFGLSGPMILSASAHMESMRPGKYTVAIDLKPALSLEQLDKRLCGDFSKYANRDFDHALSDLFPRKLIPVMAGLSGIPRDKKTHSVTREERAAFGRLIKALPVTIDSFRPIEEAIVTSGGVSVREIDPKTMMSRRVDGLYFAGELIDADAYTGGFNLQIAWSTGYAAGVSI